MEPEFRPGALPPGALGCAGGSAGDALATLSSGCLQWKRETPELSWHEAAPDGMDVESKDRNPPWDQLGNIWEGGKYLGVFNIWGEEELGEAGKIQLGPKIGKYFTFCAVNDAGLRG